MNHNLSGERLHQTQMVMKDIKLLIINEYSFLSAATINELDCQLHKIIPQTPRPFGGLNIILCGDSAQLPPVRAQPVYAHHGSTQHLVAHFYLFNKVVKLYQPFISPSRK